MSKFYSQQLPVCKVIPPSGYGSRKAALLSSGFLTGWLTLCLAAILGWAIILPVYADEDCKPEPDIIPFKEWCEQNGGYLFFGCSGGCWIAISTNDAIKQGFKQACESFGGTFSPGGLLLYPRCDWTGSPDKNPDNQNQTDTEKSPPQANFTTDPTTGESPLTVTLDASASTPQDAINNYQWVIENLTTATTPNTTIPKGPKGEVKFIETGDYQITLTVTNAKGETANTQKIVKVTPPALKMLDPACFSVGCNGEFLQSTEEEGVVTLKSPKDLLGNLVERIGVATDGVTQLVLRIKSAEAVTFILNTVDNDCQWGKLMTLDGSSTQCGSLTVAPEKIDEDNIYVMAIYQAPLNFPSESSIPVKLSLEARDASGKVLDTKELQLEPPPVILVHGVWDSDIAWKPFFLPLLKKQGYETHQVNHSIGKFLPSGTFDPNFKEPEFPAAGTFDPELTNSVGIRKLIDETKTAKENFRTRGIAVSQVDVVAHSMGGLITRATVKTQNYGYQYNRIDNYNKGDFHKIITIGTPHQGTRIADVLVHGKCRERPLKNCKCKWTIISSPSVLSSLPVCLPDCQPERLETTMVNLKHVIGPAIYGFQTGSTAIKNIGDTPVPSHAIVGIAPTGNIPPNISPTEVSLNLVFKFYAFKTVNKPSGLNTVDDILGGNENHDTIVPVESQYGGLSGDAVSIFHNVDHLGEIGGLGGKGNITIPSITVQVPVIGTVTTPEIATNPPVLNLVAPEIANEVLSLLRESPDSPAFGHFTALPQQAGNSDVKFGTDSCPATKKAVRDNHVSNAVITFEPTPGTIVTPGQKVKVSLDITDGDVQDGAIISIEGQLIGLEGAPPYVVDYTVPENAGGKINIYVQTTNGDLNTEAYAVESYLIIKLPEMGTKEITDSVAFDSEGNATETQAIFSGGISVDGGPFKKVVEFGDNLEHGAGAQSVTVKGIIIPDPDHNGKVADIFAFGEYTPYGDDLNDTTCPTAVTNAEAVPFYVMESLPKNYVVWEGAKTSSSIPAFLYKNVTLNTGEAQEFILFEGPFDARGCLSISFGYRLQDSGVVVYNHHTATVDNGIGVTVRKK